VHSSYKGAVRFWAAFMYRKIALLLSVCLSLIASAQDADLSVTKDGPLTAFRDTEVTYSVVVLNSGPATATGVVLTDTMLGDATLVSVTPSSGCVGSVCTIGTLTAGASVVYDFTFEVDPDAAGMLENTASVASATNDPNGQNNSDAVTTAILANADLTVTKTGPPAAAAGSQVSYTVTIANIGPDDAESVTLSDPIPPGMTFVSAMQDSGPTFSCIEATCTIATLPAGVSAQFTFVFEIDALTVPGTTFTNVATAGTASFDPNDENNSSAAVTTVPSPQADLAVGKNAPSFAGPGEDVTFTVTLSNAGPDAATGVSLEDTLPGTLTFVSLGMTGTALSCTTPAVGAGGTITCTAATYPAGDSTTLTITAHVPGDTPAGTEFTNTAEAKSDSDPSEENDVAVITVIVVAADVAVDKTGPATADAASNVAYGITVTNNGPDTVSVTLLDELPPGTTFVSIVRNSGPSAICSFNGDIASCSMLMGSGQTATFTLTLNSGTTLSITNEATVSVEGFDPDLANNSDSVVTTINQLADLAVTKNGPPTIIAGQNITYAISVTNNGPSAAANVSLTDAITTANATFVSATQTSGPVFNCALQTCTVASLAAGASATFDFTYAVQPDATGTVDDTATVSTTTTDNDGGNNSAQFSSTVTTSADLSLMKTGPVAAASGTDIVYTVTVQNLGPSNAVNAVMTDVLPAGTTFVSLSQSGAPFSCVTGQTVTCTAASFPAAASAEFMITAHIDASATGSVENEAGIISATPDPNAGNNTAAFETGLNPGATDLQIQKTADGATFPGGSAVTYTIVVTNNGPAVAFGTTVTDVLPAGSTLESSSATQGSCTGTTTVVCSLGTLNPAATATVTLIVRLPRTTGTVSNTATVAAANAETAPSNNSSTVPLAVTAEIPTLSQWMLILFAAMLAFVAVSAMRA